MRLPANRLHETFKQIEVTPKNQELEVIYKIRLGAFDQIIGDWETGIAVDASVSMQDAFGQGLLGELPEQVIRKYLKKGWLEVDLIDDEARYHYSQEAIKEALENGYLKRSSNLIESEARKFSSYLAEKLDEDGGTDIIYWACGEDGKSIEEYGELNASQCREMKFNGPKIFGMETHLLPAIQYFEKKYRHAQKGLFVFITDGYIVDLESVKEFTAAIAKEMEAGQRNFFKAVLIGIGGEVDERQMLELDHLDTGTSIDIWAHKMAEDVQQLLSACKELVGENMIIPQKAILYDCRDQVAARFDHGLSVTGRFKLPLDCNFFKLTIGDQTITQSTE